MQVWSSKHDRTIWRMALLKTFILGKRFRLLRKPLGKWYTDPSLHHCIWNSVVSIDERFLFHHSRHVWRGSCIVERYKRHAIWNPRPHKVLPPDFVMPAEISSVSECTVFYRSLCDPTSLHRQCLETPTLSVQWINDIQISGTSVSIALFHKTG